MAASGGYYPVDTPPGTKALPLGEPVPAMKGKGGTRPPTGKRKAGKHPPTRKVGRR